MTISTLISLLKFLHASESALAAKCDVFALMQTVRGMLLNFLTLSESIGNGT